MNKQHDISFTLASFICDLFMLILAQFLNRWLTPFWLKLVWPPEWIVKWDAFIPVSLWLPLILIWEIVFLISGVYDPKKSGINMSRAFLTGFIISSLSSAGFLYLTLRELSRWMFLFWVFISFILLLCSRLVSQIVISLLDAKNSRQRLLIVGADDLGQRLAASMHEANKKGIDLIGFVADNHPLDDEIIGTLKDVSKIIQEKAITQIIITLPSSEWAQTQQLVESANNYPVQIMIIPDYFHLSLWHPEAVEFGEFPLVDLHASPLSDYQRMIKRLFDIFCASLGLIISTPIFLLIALCIKLDTRGPVFYRQERVGENRRLFTMWKFRTMFTGADQLYEKLASPSGEGVLSFKHKNDPRVTRFGRFLRRTSLDELPQLLNILKGDMSIVGPRPELPYLVAKYEPWQRQRFAVPQGLTGWWQISARSEREMYLHTEDDLYYIRHYSLWLDMIIILRTPLAVIKGKGAY